jgi:hypothetical protein
MYMKDEDYDSSPGQVGMPGSQGCMEETGDMGVTNFELAAMLFSSIYQTFRAKEIDGKYFIKFLEKIVEWISENIDDLDKIPKEDLLYNYVVEGIKPKKRGRKPKNVVQAEGASEVEIPWDSNSTKEAPWDKE